MYGINLQLFNSKLRIPIFDNVPKKIATKIHCVSGAKIAQKFAKKICAKIAQILRKRFSHFVETLPFIPWME